MWAYQGSDSLTSTFLGIYNQMLADDYVRVVSISWGCSESCTGIGTINAMDAAFLQMVGQSWSIFAASGDNGATTGCGPQDAVSYPASDPNVTAVGWHHFVLGQWSVWQRGRLDGRNGDPFVLE